MQFLILTLQTKTLQNQRKKMNLQLQLHFSFLLIFNINFLMESLTVADFFPIQVYRQINDISLRRV